MAKPQAIRVNGATRGAASRSHDRAGMSKGNMRIGKVGEEGEETVTRWANGAKHTDGEERNARVSWRAGTGGEGGGTWDKVSVRFVFVTNECGDASHFHTPFHTRTPRCPTRTQAVSESCAARQSPTRPQAVTRPGTGYVHGCPLTTPNRPSRLPPSRL